MTSYVYVASSWRNELQPKVVDAIRAAGIDAYDFKNPEGSTGFHWSEVGLHRDNDAADAAEYLAALEHPRALAGFDSDFVAMRRADAFVLVLPSGRSSHLEAGWAIGAGKPTAVLLDDPCTPELMYSMAAHLTTDIDDLVSWVAEQPTHPRAGIRVTSQDLETGERQEVVIDNNFVVVTAGDRYVSAAQRYASGTAQITIKRRTS